MVGHFGVRDTIWKGNQLFLGRRKIAEVVQDQKYPSMWRVKTKGALSDMLNRTRAKDAAFSFAMKEVRATGEAASSHADAIPEGGR